MEPVISPTEDASSDTAPLTPEEIMQQLLDVREKYHQKAYTNIRIAQERQKNYYDARHDMYTYNVH